jgi:hypothetical protein
MTDTGARSWAVEEFGKAEFGDARLTARLVHMAMACASSPSGRVSDVFSEDAGLQGAYDFIEGGASRAGVILRSCQEACARRASEYPYVFVPVDGTSLSLVDRAKTKNFGPIGTRAKGGRGLKVIDSIAVSPDGVPLGLAAMQWWARGKGLLKRARSRPPKDRETQHWIDAVHDVVDVFERHAPQTKAWFQLDREADAWRLLSELSSTGHFFTVRSSGTRRLRAPGRKYLRSYVSRRPAQGQMKVEVPARRDRPARTARMTVRFCEVVLELRDKWTKKVRPIKVTVVYVRESHAPRGVKALDWLLITNRPVKTLKDAKLVIRGYTQRWRIEDFHKTWKSGVCDVESTQLRDSTHVITWATLLAAVATRVERLKHLAREKPDAPASEELSLAEVRALILLRRKHKRRNEEVPDTMPSIATATTWIARLGGYTGERSGGPPGSITIGRGLERLRAAAELIEVLGLAEKTS